MAQTINERWQPGTLVYMAYSPQKAGKIIEDMGPKIIVNQNTQQRFESSFRTVKVKWVKDGSVTTEDTGSLRDFDSLIEDHRRKLKTHETMLERLKKL